jgi:hypothetical protein
MARIREAVERPTMRFVPVTTRWPNSKSQFPNSKSHRKLPAGRPRTCSAGPALGAQLTDSGIVTAG